MPHILMKGMQPEQDSLYTDMRCLAFRKVTAPAKIALSEHGDIADSLSMALP